MELEKINQLLEHHKTLEAINRLVKLDKKYPKNPDILELMATSYAEQKNHYGFLITMLQLHELLPNRWNIVLGLADAYLVNDFNALAFKTFRHFIRQWPQNENAPRVQKTIQILEQFVDEVSSNLTFSFEDGLIFFAKHEEIQLLMNQGDYGQCKVLAKELLSQRPSFAPVKNNLSKISWLEGNLAQAIDITRGVLADQPDNVHALSNMCCYLYMQGEKEHALELAKRLKNVEILSKDHWLVIVKALSFIEDINGVIELFEKAKPNIKNDLISPPFFHYCAAAEYQIGEVSEAKILWQKSADEEPNFLLATENLKELEKPIYERTCPQTFTMDEWLPKQIIKDLTLIFTRASVENERKNTRDQLGSYIEKHPLILHFIPAALRNGDHVARKLALDLAEFAPNTILDKSLESFVLGREGPDSLRIETAHILARKGVLENGKKIDLWIKGELRSVIMVGFEIVSGPPEKDNLHPSVKFLMEEAIDDLRRANGEKAERKLRKAIAIQPNEPSLLNNLAVSLQMQGRMAEANALADQIEKNFPDYFFGQLIAVKKSIAAGRIEKAKKILDRLMKKERLHVTEFSALCACQIDFDLMKKDLEDAKTWLRVWQGIYPEDPSLERYRDLKKLM